MSIKKAAVFASGTGSNFEAIMEAGELGCEIVLLVCDKENAKVLEKAAHYDIPTFTFNVKNYESKEEYEKDILTQLHAADVEWVFLAGYMRLIGKELLHAYEEKIINIHPSYLPAYPGKDAIGQAFRAKVKTTGVTIHYVDEGMDTGPVIKQEKVEILPNDTIDTLAKRIHKVEHRLYPEVIRSLMVK